MNIRQRTFPGTTTPEPQPFEAAHRAIARKAAAAGMVLLKNEGLLPLAKGSHVALYGPGAVCTVKGGTGSGDVNAREVISVWQGMKAAGYHITNEDWLEDYAQCYHQARLAWRQVIWDKMDTTHNNLFLAYSSTPFLAPVGRPARKTGADTALYVLSRTAGEAADRHAGPGDYELTQEEEQAIATVCACHENVVLVLNVGGVVDLSILDKEPKIKAVVLMHQAGMESGHALADVLSGAVTPSGKLTDTWAFHYADYPNAATFSHNNGNVQQELYTEGLYVGYRYFDAFQVPVRYGFGEGLSYASFTLETKAVHWDSTPSLDARVTVSVQVTNTSARYSGKEVVQVYAACPQNGLEKEYRRLVGFCKTKLLAPGEGQLVEVSFPLRALMSYDEGLPAWVLAQGAYGLFVGASLNGSHCDALLELTGRDVLEHTENVCPIRQQLDTLHPASLRQPPLEDAFLRLAVDTAPIADIQHTYGPAYDSVSPKALAFVDTLTTEQLIHLATGETTKAQAGSNIGAAGITVPGSAAETSNCAVQQGMAEIVLADGPAGLRLIREYYISDKAVQAVPFDMAIEEGFLCRNPLPPVGQAYYQYCTAIPVGTLLAQTWDPALVSACGKAVAEEMAFFGVTLWLAPGMNIHRNPLCGRNFEYYAEDPVLSGLMAAAMTQGVQSIPGCGTTIKHFACNNQEDNRTGSDSILPERVLREIYLRGFEIAVRQSHPLSLMTSYNLVNGVHAANSYDLCTRVLRNEWGYRGLVMTDWSTTEIGPDCTATGCMQAGNDVVMPGTAGDHENLRQSLANGTLAMRDLKRSIARLTETVWLSDRYE